MARAKRRKARRNQELTLDQCRDMLTEEIEDWRDEEPMALNDVRFWALIGEDAGIEFTVTGKALHTVHEEGWDEAIVTRYDLSKQKDRDHIASELLKQVDYASKGQVKAYMDHRDALFLEE